MDQQENEKKNGMLLKARPSEKLYLITFEIIVFIHNEWLKDKTGFHLPMYVFFFHICTSIYLMDK